MSELVQLAPEKPEDQSQDMVEQNAPLETGLMRLEQEETLEKSDIDALQQKAGELRGMSEVQRGLETSIIGAGLQVIADRYGADKLLAAMQEHGTGSFQHVINKLAPEKSEREGLYEAIKSEPMDTLAERFDETLGGVADGNPRVSQMERFRHFEVSRIQGNDVQRRSNGPIGSKLYKRTNKEGMTDGGYPLFSRDFDDVLSNNPTLAENFRETNDTLGLLKGIREIYETEYAQFSSDLEQAKATVEAKIAEGEVGVAELQTLSDDIYSDEIAKLEERLAAASSEEAKEMVQGMLDKKAAEVMAAREEFKTKTEAVRSKIIADLGADRLYGLSGGGSPAKPEPTYNDKEEPTWS